MKDKKPEPHESSRWPQWPKILIPPFNSPQAIVRDLIALIVCGALIYGIFFTAVTAYAWFRGAPFLRSVISNP